MAEQSGAGSDPISVANRWIEAHNAKDYDTLASLMADDLHMVHHNRGVDLTGREAALGIMTVRRNHLDEAVPSDSQAVHRRRARGDRAVI
jgi:ketosteroid isomerase-like protein